MLHWRRNVTAYKQQIILIKSLGSNAEVFILSRGTYSVRCKTDTLKAVLQIVSRYNTALVGKYFRCGRRKPLRQQP